MSRKNINRYPVAKAQSLATSFKTSPTMVSWADNVGYQVNVLTTNSTGTITVEGSIDYARNEANGDVVSNPGTWVTLTLSSTPTVNAANDSILINLDMLPFNAVRLSYTSVTPGTGTCDVYVMTKQAGG